ncbi:MAG: tRNA lysidine(34) synthetase TilS [Flavobacteriaceae bacterium]|nr:tRNA lysidine(34) synthetase TilS [Flavobacteriaceae bacterium]
MLSAFITHIDTVFPELRESSFLIACSGGVDSTVLAHLCHKADLSFALAHVNYQLRDAESDADAQFTASLADEFGVPYYSTSFDTAALKVEEEGSLQQIARKLRYSWFDELLEQEDFTYVVTAHHRDDNLETFLIHVLRGTGIDGLTGIPAKRGQIRRPLLQFSKEEIQVYAGENKLQWREDKTNETDDYLRNTVRHKLVPVFKELNPDILSALETTQDHLINSSKIVNNEIQRIKKQLFTYKNNRIEIDIKGLKSLMTPRAYLFPLLTPYGFTDWPAIEELLEAESGKKVYSGTHVLLKDRNTWILEEITPNKENKKTLEEAADSLFNMLEIEEVASFEKGDANTLYIDKESLNHRLRVRNWQKGDYFYPQGMGGKRKKLSKYYKDIKLDVLKKPRQWLLCDGDEIVWVIGKRGDERYKVTDKTKKILRIKVIK